MDVVVALPWVIDVRPAYIFFSISFLFYLFIFVFLRAVRYFSSTINVPVTRTGLLPGAALDREESRSQDRWFTRGSSPPTHVGW